MVKKNLSANAGGAGDVGSVPGLGSNILLTGSRSAANMIFVHRRKIPYLGRWVDGQESGEMTDFRMSF